MKSLHLLLIKCEIKLDFPWSKKLAISEKLNNTEVPPKQNANPSIQHFPEGFTTGGTFKIKSSNFYVPAVTLSINNNTKFL